MFKNGARYAFSTIDGNVLPKTVEAIVLDHGLSFTTAQALTKTDLASLNYRVFTAYGGTEFPNANELEYIRVSTPTGVKVLSTSWIVADSVTPLTEIPKVTLDLLRPSQVQISQVEAVLRTLGVSYKIKF